LFVNREIIRQVSFFRKIYNPALFQGSLAKKRYFEGWYFKMVSPNDRKIAVIPGIAIIGKNHPDNHSFIQFIDGNTGKTGYFRFGLADFKPSKKHFHLQIGRNSFSGRHLSLDLDQNGWLIKGSVGFEALHPAPVSLLTPGIMGWYRYVPFMECYHGILSMSHGLQGSMTLDKSIIDFSHGKGYIEKDWGRSFPSAYIWLQSNHFSEEELSFMLSIARIPWLNGSFIGFLSVLYYKGEMHRFATYTGASIIHLEVWDHSFRCTIEDKRFSIIIDARGTNHGNLLAPTIGSMDRIIRESMDASLVLTFCDHRENRMIFTGEGQHAGLEMVDPSSFSSEFKTQRSSVRKSLLQ